MWLAREALTLVLSLMSLLDQTDVPRQLEL